jgi:hypothetical protein
MECLTIKCDDFVFKDPGATVFDTIDIISGACIFNADILKTSTYSSNSGEFDIEKLRQARPTSHEMDYISRSSTAIADIAGVLVSRVHGHGVQVPVRISLDIPSFHYDHSAITTFDDGVCTAEEALHWFEAVDFRRDQIAHVFTTAVRHQLRRRGVDPADYEIRDSSKATPMASLIKAALQDHRSPSLDNVLQELDKGETGPSRASHLFQIPRDIEKFTARAREPYQLGISIGIHV